MNSKIKILMKASYKYTIAHFLKRKASFVKRVILLVLFVTLASTGCTDNNPEEDENGTIGTGIILDGIVSDTLLARGADVETVSKDGKRGAIEISANRSFSTASLPGTGPWLLRANINADRELYGIAYSDGTRNINAFSDVGLRRWLAQRSFEIENVFNTTDGALELPTSLDYDESVESIVELIDLVLASYEVSGSDIISSKYVADDTGVDAFLRRNTVVVENDVITFLVTDRATDIKAETRSATALTGNTVDSGNGPTTPGSIRALNGGMNDIVLIWEPSVDDIGVIGYVVFRDELLLGTTPYPQYIDTGLVSNQLYSYGIVAVDGNDNFSERSLSVTGTPSQESVAGVPASPQLLSEVSVSGSTIRLAWVQSVDTTVASYIVYRGVGSSSSRLPLQRVSVPRAIDTEVAIGETYCYQVSAVSATGQESLRSDELCVDTGAPDSEVTNTDFSEPVVDVSCEKVLTTADIPVGQTTITDGCYSVPQTLVIKAGATLQINEGVVLKFDESTKLVVEGTITVLGTRDNRVVFTGMITVPGGGGWGGVEFKSPNSVGNILRGAIVQYAGGGDVSAAVSTIGPNNRIRMEDTIVRYNAGLALSFIQDSTQIISFDGNEITVNSGVGNVTASAVQAFTSRNQYFSNTINELNLVGTDFTGEDIVIPNIGIPMSWAGLTIENGSLTIMPGADLEMTGGSLIDVDGPVTINGEPGNPITLRGGVASDQGYWDGIRLRGSGDKMLNHVNISNGGASGANTGAIEIDCTGSSNFDVQIDNTNISQSASWGLLVKGRNCDLDIGSSNTFSNNAAGNINTP